MAVTDPVGRVLAGAYRIERLIGEGGMGSVFEASHIRLPRRFAIKLLNPEVLGNRDVFERFQREAQIASALGHEHIVQVFDFNFTEDGLPYMVLELLQGEDLAARIASRGRLSLAETASVLDQLSGALEQAHQHGIVHRDLKPQNIFLCRTRTRDDFVKILDFGISKILYSGHVSTRTGAVMGTPNYMSPEQAEGKQSAIDARTDLFALGSILYECLTGRMAFRADSVLGALYQVCHGAPDPLRALVPEVPEAVEQVLARALAKRPEERYQDIGSMRYEFLAAAGAPQAPSLPTQVPSRPLSEPAPSKTKTTLSDASGEWDESVPARGRGRWIAAAVVGVGMVVAVVLAMSGSGDTKRSAAGEPGAGATLAGSVARTEPSDAGGVGSSEVAPATIQLSLQVAPPTATVELDGVVTRDNPIALPQSTKTHKLLVRAKGYLSESRAISAQADDQVVVSLKRDPVGTPGKRTGKGVNTSAGTSTGTGTGTGTKIKVEGPVEDDLD